MLCGRILALIVLVSAFAFTADDAKKPGTVNFVKGVVFLQNNLVHVDEDNPPVIEVAQRLRSDKGNAEVFSTEGSFMRLAANSEVELVATDGTAATVRLHSGSIIIDAFKIKKSSPLIVLVGDTETTIASKGEFRFDISGDSSSALHVLKGKVMLAAAGSSQELKKKQVAEVTVAGVQDAQVPIERVEALYRDLGSKQKVFVDLACSSHNAMWETNRLLLFNASVEWLTSGTVEGKSSGEIRLGY